jgi:hypothetical protein
MNSRKRKETNDEGKNFASLHCEFDFHRQLSFA